MCYSNAKLFLINIRNDAFEALTDVTYTKGAAPQYFNADNPFHNQYCVNKPNKKEGMVCEKLPPPCSILRAGHFTITSDCIMYYEIVVKEMLNIIGVPDANGVLPKLIGVGHNRMFKVEAGGGLSLQNLNLTGGVRTTDPCDKPDYSGCFGGIVYITQEAGMFTADNTIFHGGKAKYGGCIMIRGGETTIMGSSVIDCSASMYGGGVGFYPIGARGRLTISDTIVYGNSAGLGGGIYVRVDKAKQKKRNLRDCFQSGHFSK
jgi:hypothetical protein